MNHLNRTGNSPNFLYKVYTFLLISGSYTLALPSTTPLPSTATPKETTTSSTSYLPAAVLRVSSSQLAILGLLLSILGAVVFRTIMPKQLKDRKQEKVEYRPSPLSVSRPWQTEKLVHIKAEKDEEDVMFQKATPRKAINDIWIEAVQKGQKSGAKRTKSWTELDNSEATNPITAPACPPLAPSTYSQSESCNFGDNPTYHDDGFKFIPIDPQIMGAAPLPSYTSGSPKNRVPKVVSHKRTISSPQRLFNHALENSSQNPVPAQWPLPTIRPASVPAGTPTSNAPNGPLHPVQPQEAGPGQVSVFRYTRQYSQKQFQQHRRAHSVPTAEGAGTPGPDGTGPSGDNQAEEFLPVMIFEHGQSVTGQRWRRKVTVFRSEVLQSLEKEGMITCPS